MYPCTGVWEYIEATRDMVCDLEHRVRLAKGNVESIITLMSGWCQIPLYRRREDKKEQSLLNLEVRREGGEREEREREREMERGKERRGEQPPSSA